MFMLLIVHSSHMFGSDFLVAESLLQMGCKINAIGGG